VFFFEATSRSTEISQNPSTEIWEGTNPSTEISNIVTVSNQLSTYVAQNFKYLTNAIKTFKLQKIEAPPFPTAVSTEINPLLTQLIKLIDPSALRALGVPQPNEHLQTESTTDETEHLVESKSAKKRRKKLAKQLKTPAPPSADEDDETVFED
jgi:hypothetical protein